LWARLVSDNLKLDVLMARQPIYDRKLDIYGYELLFRTEADQLQANVFDGELATSRVILNAMTAIENADNKHHAFAFVNLTEPMLLSDEPPPVPKDLAIIEILEDVEVTQKLIDNVERFSKQGFIYALDDFEYHPKYVPLFKLVDIIKIDIMAVPLEKLPTYVKNLRPYGVKLLAEKIETHEEFEQCLELGFDYFQGYFLHKPILIKGTSIKANDQVVLRLLARLSDPNIDPEEIASLVSIDPHLSYQILRIINSAAYTTVKKVESINHAIVMLGLQQVKTWASMISLSNMEDKPGDQVEFILTRAKLCEEVALKTGENNGSAFFTAGMLSGLDVLLGVELENALETLPILPELRNAILNYEGKIGQVLRYVQAYECARWQELDEMTLGINAEEFNKAHIDSINWVVEILGAIKQ
jgi:c-di-GMP phosphodiesterase